jgi:hypothetical protein
LRFLFFFLADQGEELFKEFLVLAYWHDCIEDVVVVVSLTYVHPPLFLFLHTPPLFLFFSSRRIVIIVWASVAKAFDAADADLLLYRHRLIFIALDTCAIIAKELPGDLLGITSSRNCHAIAARFKTQLFL